MDKNLTLVFGLQIHNKVTSHIITGQKPQFLTTPLLFILFKVKSLFFIINETTYIIKEYNISIRIVFLKKIIIYFIVPKRVSKEEPSLVQKIRPNMTFIILVVIKAEEHNLQI